MRGCLRSRASRFQEQALRPQLTTLEALETLNQRARRLGNRLYAVAGLALAANAAALYWLAIELQWAMTGVAFARPAAAFGIFTSVTVGVWLARLIVRRLIATRRKGWIDELAPAGGARRAELESNFRLDNW